MSCVAWPNQTPIGTASNFLQCKWVSCSKSYWQGYDLGWYKDMGPLVFRNQIYGWRNVHQCHGQFSRSLLSYPPRNYELEKNLHSIAGGKRGRFCRCSVCAVCCVCSVSRRLAVCAVLRDGARWRRWWAQRHNRAMRPQCFIPTSQKHSLSLLVSPDHTSRQRQTRRPRLLFSVSAKCLHEWQQQQEEAATAPGGSSSRRKQQQQEAAEAAAAAGSNRRKQQQQQQAEAAAAAGGGSSSSRRKQ